MAIIDKHLAGSLRFINDADQTISSYHRIRPCIDATQVESFLQAVTLLRGHGGGNAFLTITTELVDTDA